MGVAMGDFELVQLSVHRKGLNTSTVCAGFWYPKDSLEIFLKIRT